MKQQLLVNKDLPYFKHVALTFCCYLCVSSLKFAISGAIN